ncbi:MAG: response regulator [Bacteroidia bacterium]|nr:response regulator [Bacteroidia bacterium]
MEKTLRILVVEDSEDDALLVLHLINKGDYNIVFERVETAERMKTMLKERTWDIILSDYVMPHFNGLEALELLKESGIDIPFIIISGTIGEDVAVEAMKGGANDYIMKNNLQRLLPAIDRELRESGNRAERKRAEEELRILSRAVEQSPASIIITDTEGKIKYVNSKFTEITGYTPNEVLGQNPRILKSGEMSQDYYKEMWQSIALGNEWFGEFHNKKKNGELYWELVSISPIFDTTGIITHFLAVKEDITSRKQTEQELINAKEKAEESERLKTAFLTNMSHEIRTPMNGILGFAELLKEPNLSGAEQQEYINIIGKSGVRMLNIINNIVDISKIEAGLMDVHMKESNVNEQIECIYTFFKPEVEDKGMKLFYKNDLPTKEAIIGTDTEKVYSILTNLVKNAIKYTEEGSIEFGYVKKGDDLEFYVKDTGIGIPKERQDAIFERFIQADITDKMALQGAGLGLTIAKSYVEMLGGKIWIESEEGIGSTFYFTLPYNSEQEEKKVTGKVVQTEEVKNQIYPKVSGLKVLIAEDDETSEMFMSILAKTFGKEILKARTGLETIDICRNNPDIDLILMDIQMPEMNGSEATRQIRQFNKEVIIIAQTSYGLAGDRGKAMEDGCNDYISKPINKGELLALIQKYFKKYP